MALNIICYLVLSEMRQRGWVWHKILLTGFPFFPISNAKCHRFVPLELPCQKRTIFTQYIMASLRMWYHFHSPWEWYKNIVTALWDIYKTGTSTWRISQLRNNSVSRIIFFLFFIFLIIFFIFPYYLSRKRWAFFESSWCITIINEKIRKEVQVHSWRFWDLSTAFPSPNPGCHVLCPFINRHYILLRKVKMCEGCKYCSSHHWVMHWFILGNLWAVEATALQSHKSQVPQQSTTVELGKLQSQD